MNDAIVQQRNKARKQSIINLFSVHIHSKEGKESQLILVLAIFDRENTFFLSIKIESGLRSFEKNNIIERTCCKRQKQVIIIFLI